MPASYVDTISAYYPGRLVHAQGDGYDYGLLISQDGKPLPPQSELDEKRLALGRERVWRKIQAYREAKKYDGVKVAGKWFHTDDSSRIQHIGLVMMGANLPAINWKTLDGSFIVMTPQLAQGIFQAVSMSDIGIFTVAEQHRMAVMQSQTPSTYDFTQGWPVTFSLTEPTL